MAIYRNIELGFWDDPKVEDEFTPEDKYFFLFVLTNPYTNLCGCYEISLKQMSRKTGYNEETIKRLIERLQDVHKVIRYDFETKELLIFNWYKYNWTKSEKLEKPILAQIDKIKSNNFKAFLTELFYAEDRVSIRYRYGIDTTVSVSDTVTDSVSASFNNNINSNNKNNSTVKSVVYYPNDEELDTAFKDFVDMRKKIKKPLTDRAVELAIKKLNELSNNDNNLAIKIIEQSVMNSWQSFYPLKETNEIKRTSNSKNSLLEEIARA